MSKYEEEKWESVPKRVPRYRWFGLWGVISSLGDVSNVVGGGVGEVFEKGFKVEHGDRVRFCFDDWLGVGPLPFCFL